MRAIATEGAHECLRSGVTTVGRLQLRRRGRGGRRRDGAARDRLPRGLRRATRRRWSGSTSCASGSSPRSPTVCALGVSPHAPYTCTLELYAACAALGLPIATHLAESVAERAFLLDGSGDWSAFADMLVPPPGTTGDPHARRGRAPRAGHDGGALRRRRRPRRSRCSPRTASGSRTARARTGSSAAASRRSQTCSRPGSPSGSPPTAPPRRRRSTCSTSSAPRSSPRGRASGAPMR